MKVVDNDRTKVLGISGCKTIRNKDGREILDVCIIPAKDMDKNDILLIPRDPSYRAKSMRSIAELVNNLKKEEIPHDEILDTLEFAWERLRLLGEEENEISGFAGPIGGNKKSRKKIE